MNKRTSHASLDSVLADYRKRIANLERSSKVSSSGISNGQLRLYDTSGNIIVEFGTQDTNYVASGVTDNVGLSVRGSDGMAGFAVSDSGLYSPWQAISPNRVSESFVTNSFTYQEVGSVLFFCTARYLSVDFTAWDDTGAGDTTAVRIQANLPDEAEVTILEETSFGGTPTAYQEDIDLSSFTELGSDDVIGSQVQLRLEMASTNYLGLMYFNTTPLNQDL